MHGMLIPPPARFQGSKMSPMKAKEEVQLVFGLNLSVAESDWRIDFFSCLALIESMPLPPTSS